MKRLLPFFLLLTTATIYSQTAAPAKEASLDSCSMINGRMWRMITDPMKTFYLVGVTEILARETKSMSIYFAAANNIGENVEALNKLYEDPANLIIPVAEMLPITKARFEGANAAKVESLLEEARRWVAKCPENDKAK